jgi:hypothetical protein
MGYELGQKAIDLKRNIGYGAFFVDRNSSAAKAQRLQYNSFDSFFINLAIK